MQAELTIYSVLKLRRFFWHLRGCDVYRDAAVTAQWRTSRDSQQNLLIRTVCCSQHEEEERDP
jgi:hypothetical protein